jgi:hypothetical protein
VQIRATGNPASLGAAGQVAGRAPGWPPPATPGSTPGDMRIPAARDRATRLSQGFPGPGVTGARDAAPVTVPLPGGGGRHRDRSGAWLRNAAAGLGVLAAAAAAVSFSAQYQMIYAARGLAVVAVLEAAIPDAAAVVFACLGIALALHGRHAVRARVLNVAAVGTSVFMNAIAAAPGWRSLAIWVLPPVAYALASDTLIGVVRAQSLARHKPPGARMAGEEATPLAAVGGLVLWLLRLALAPGSTLAGFRTWVLEECPIAPGRRASRQAAAVSPATARKAIRLARPGTPARGETKTARFLALVAERHGPLAAVPVAEVSKICSELAPQAGLNTGAARAALRRAVLAAQDGAGR